MAANIIDGKAIAAKLRENLRTKLEACEKKPCLAVVLVGNSPASVLYTKMKQKACEEVGMSSKMHELSDDASQDMLLSLIRKLNKRTEISGILVQLPLPRHMDEKMIINEIDPAKDVDGFHPTNLGRLMTGQHSPVAATPLGCKILIEDAAGKLGMELKGKNAVVVGRSNIVGKPMFHLLLRMDMNVTMCHSKTTAEMLKDFCRNADVLVAAAGVPGLIKKDMIRPGAIVIDVGTTKVDGRLIGDVCFEDALMIAGAITPVPGGVGPMTIACLLENTYNAYLAQQNSCTK